MKAQNLRAIISFSIILIFLPIHSMRLTKMYRPIVIKEGSALFKNNRSCFFGFRYLAQQANDNKDLHERYEENYSYLQEQQEKYLNAFFELNKKREKGETVHELDYGCKRGNGVIGMGLGFVGATVANLLGFNLDGEGCFACIILGGLGAGALGSFQKTKYTSLKNLLSQNYYKAENNYKKLLEQHKELSKLANKKCEFSAEDIKNFKVESYRVVLCLTCKKPLSEMKDCSCDPKQAEEKYISYLVKMKDF